MANAGHSKANPSSNGFKAFTAILPLISCVVRKRTHLLYCELMPLPSASGGTDWRAAARAGGGANTLRPPRSFRSLAATLSHSASRDMLSPRSGVFKTV
jgi:hypothetical protein